MDRDRAEICEIISEMLDNPNESGIYGTGLAYDRLEALVSRERMQALGYGHGYACNQLDSGVDPRDGLVPEIIADFEATLV